MELTLFIKFICYVILITDIIKIDYLFSLELYFFLLIIFFNQLE